LLILNSYVSIHHFNVKVDTELTDLTLVNSRVPQAAPYLSPIHSRPSHFTWLHHSLFYRRHCVHRHRLWSCHCFSQTPSLFPRNPILAKHMAYES
jgi:hypothetical protein